MRLARLEIARLVHFFVGIFSAVALIFFAYFTSEAAIRLSGWKQTAFDYYRQDKNEKALTILKQNPEDRFSKVLSPFVYHQIWVYTPSKENQAQAKESMKGLENTVGFEDIDYLVLVGEALDKPAAAEKANVLLKDVFSNIRDVDAGRVLVNYIGSPNPKISEYALDSLEDLLKTRRKIVNEGGNLRDKDIALMTDSELLNQLAAIVSQTEVNGKEPTNPDGVSAAMDCMVYVEEPSLKVLEKSSGTGVSKAVTKINESINKRRKKYPNSTWYSAMGVKR